MGARGTLSTPDRLLSTGDVADLMNRANACTLTRR